MVGLIAGCSFPEVLFGNELFHQQKQLGVIVWISADAKTTFDIVKEKTLLAKLSDRLISNWKNHKLWAIVAFHVGDVYCHFVVNAIVGEGESIHLVRVCYKDTT